MDTHVLSVAVVGLAVGALAFAPPLDLASSVVLGALTLYSIWTRKNALERTAQGVSDRLDQELGEAIEEARRRAHESIAKH